MRPTQDRMRALAAIAVLASLGCGCLAAQARPAGKRFTLSGTVVDGVSNRPLAGVEVSLQTDKWAPAGDAVTSDAQGRFVVGGLAAGEYILSATDNAFGTVHYGEAPDPGWVSTVHLGTKGEDKSIVFPIVPRAAIEGVVRDEFGDPMMRASVFLLRPLWADGRNAMRTISQKSTDDRGHYRFANLPPGNYLVCIAASQNGDSTAPLQGPVDFAARLENRFYIRTCYPAANGASSRAYPLGPGQHAQIDLVPLAALTATVRGRVRNVPPQTGFSVYLTPDDGSSGQPFSAFMDPAQGTFVIRGVPQGRYRLRADVAGPAGGGQKQLTAEIPVDVGGSDLDGIDLTLDTGGAVDVVFHGVTENHIDPVSVNATLRPADSSIGARGAQRDKDGSFHFEGLPPGRFWLVAHTAAETCVDSVKVGDREVRGAPLEIGARTALRLDVTVSKNCGAIQSRAVRDGEAVPGAKMVLLRSGTAKDPGELVEDFANDEGELSFAGLPPGRYLLWAWAVTGKGAIAGPPSVAAVEQQATTVEVKEGEPVHIDVLLLKDGGKAQ